MENVKLSKKLIIIIAAVLVLLIGGGVVYATNTPTARADRQLNLGNKYLQEGKYQEAILAFQKVIEIEPKNIPARLGLGQVYIATKEFTKAEIILKEVIVIDQKNIPVREDLFNVYLKEGNLDAANAIVQEITKIDINKDVKRLNSDLDSAKTINASKASYDLGIKQMSNKQYLEAVDSFQKVIKEDTERYADAQQKAGDCKTSFKDDTLQKAKVAASNKEYQSALDLLDQVLKVDPNNQDALKLKSEYSNLLKEQDKVANYLSQEQPKVTNKNQVIIFKDKNLEKQIRRTIEKNDGNITIGDLENMTGLDASGAGIRDITGIEYCTNITALQFATCQISNISALKRLENLTLLYLGGNNISDINALKGLTNLTELYLENNQISDISALSGLNKLIILNLGRNKIKDYSPVRGYYNQLQYKDFTL